MRGIKRKWSFWPVIISAWRISTIGVERESGQSAKGRGCATAVAYLRNADATLRLPYYLLPYYLNMTQGPSAGRIHPIPRIHRPLLFRLYRSPHHLPRRPRNGDQDLDGILCFGGLHETRGRRRGGLVMDRSGLRWVASGTSWVYQEGRVRGGDPGLVGESLCLLFRPESRLGDRESERIVTHNSLHVCGMSTDSYVPWMGGTRSSVRCQFHRLVGTFPGTRIRVKLLHRSVQRQGGLHRRRS